VLRRGEIRECGTHAELVQKGGLYARLWRLQDLGVNGKGNEDRRRKRKAEELPGYDAIIFRILYSGCPAAFCLL
jgi:hypothetical protein